MSSDPEGAAPAGSSERPEARSPAGESASTSRPAVRAIADAERVPTSAETARHHWVGSLVSLVVVLAVLALFLRLLHVGLPMFYPRVLQGPFSVDDFGEVERYAGFSPLVPFFRPQQLGPRPVHVTVYRRPHARVVALWQGERFLYLEQTRGGRPPQVPPDAQPLAVTGGASWWRHGRTRHVVARREGVWVEIRTDLEERDVRRVVETLRRYEELL
jgi:hypothetical protein